MLVSISDKQKHMLMLILLRLLILMQAQKPMLVLILILILVLIRTIWKPNGNGTCTGNIVSEIICRIKGHKRVTGSQGHGLSVGLVMGVGEECPTWVQKPGRSVYLWHVGCGMQGEASEALSYIPYACSCSPLPLPISL